MNKISIVKSILKKKPKKIIVKGKTYPIRGLLKGLGYKFNKYGSHWEIDTCMTDKKVRKIISMAKDPKYGIWLENTY